MTAVIAVSSGTAKVGKTFLSANLAHYLGEKSSRTALLVAGSSHPILDVQPKRTWPDIIHGRLTINQAIESTVYGIDMLVTQGQADALVGLSPQATDRLGESIRDMHGYAYLVVDMVSGPAAMAVACCLAATESILVVTADTISLTAAYEWLGRLARHGFKGPVNMVLNQVKKPALAQSVFIRFRDLAHRKLNIQVNLWGSLSFDETAQEPGSLDRPLAISQPDSKLLGDIQIIGDRLLAEQPPENQTQPLELFWQAFIKQLQALPEMPDRLVPPQAAAEKEIHKRAVRQKETAHKEGTKKTQSDFTAALNDVTDQLSVIATELGTIRRLMENGAVPDRNAGSGGTAGSEIQTILDFDAFVSRRQKAK
jgi:MinD-like ATPase involved in chromosome partitioning or flagellar assembly